jgi:serine/threonine protein kinase
LAGRFRPLPTPKAGLVLGERYRIIGLLGVGSTAEVYLAEDAQSQSAVIVKWLTPRPARDPQVRERFIMGARAAMAVEHRGVARVMALEEPLGEPPYLIMEALVGEPLSDYLERTPAMAEPLVLSLAREVAAGLLAAHRVGIVHRDLKPANLFLLGEPTAPTGVKIIDFGFAKDTRDPEAGPSSTNLVLGTAQYMAPEQVLADPVDARTDVYGFGAVLFRMLTGHLPFDLDPGADLFSHQLFSPAPPPSWLVEHLDPRLEQIVLRCMRKHPENRYSSFERVLADLDVVVGVQPGTDGAISELPLVRDPDVYKPRNQRGRDAAESLAAYFGTEAPPPLTVRLGSVKPPEPSD